MESNEKIIFTNSFGKVTEKRIIVNLKNGNQDIPLQKIASVGFERKRRVPIAILYYVISGLFLYEIAIQGSLPGYLIVVITLLVIFFLLSGTAYFIGSYRINIHIEGSPIKPIKVEMAKTKAGHEFAEAVRNEIVK